MDENKAHTIIKNIVGNIFKVSPYAIDIGNEHITIRIWEDPEMAEDIAAKIGTIIDKIKINADGNGIRYTIVYHIKFPIWRLFECEP